MQIAENKWSMRWYESCIICANEVKPHMTRCATIIALLTLALSVSVFGQTIDPVGFCPPPATATACTTATGLGGQETISVGAKSVGMYKNGNGGMAVNPWQLLVAVPNDIGGAPTITFANNAFTQVGTTADKGKFLPTAASSIYVFAGTTGDTS